MNVLILYLNLEDGRRVPGVRSLMILQEPRQPAVLPPVCGAGPQRLDRHSGPCGSVCATGQRISII